MEWVSSDLHSVPSSPPDFPTACIVVLCGRVCSVIVYVVLAISNSSLYDSIKYLLPSLLVVYLYMYK